MDRPSTPKEKVIDKIWECLLSIPDTMYESDKFLQIYEKLVPLFLEAKDSNLLTCACDNPDLCPNCLYGIQVI